MEKRTAESPMDFEWQTRAPGDVSSPFYQLSVHHDNQKKRTHSTFDSPTKKSLPSLREPNSQPFFFSEPQPPLSPLKSGPMFGQPAFMTPRKLDLDFSSGVSSPENDDDGTDNEDTPEKAQQQQQLPKTGKQNSLFGLYGRFAPSPSPGRGEIPRLNHYSNAVARRVHKRRQRDREIDRRLLRRGPGEGGDEGDEGDDSDDTLGGGGRAQRQKQKQRKGQPGKEQNGQGKWTAWFRLSSFGDFFALLEAHPHVPSILSWWAQLVVNLSLFTLAVYVVFGFVSAIRVEFDHAAEERSDVILAEMAMCAKSYVDNKCAGGNRLPALETVCENWERCMNRDPAKVGRAKLSAHTMAEIINNFIDPISWKAILFFLATISTVTAVSNWSFRSFRDRLNQQDYAHHPAPNFSNQHHPGQHHQPLHFQNMPGTTSFGYFGGHQDQSRVLPRPNEFQDKQDDLNEPLMIESSPTVDFVSGRGRERERQLRSPSPVKRLFSSN